MASGNGSSNAEVVTRLLRGAVNEGSDEVAEELISSSYVHHAASGRDPGPRGFIDGVKAFKAAFPDFQINIQDVIAGDDKVVVRSNLEGTHTGEFLGISPTGRTISVSTIAIFRVEGGQVAEEWEHMDTAGLMRQLA